VTIRGYRGAVLWVVGLVMLTPVLIMSAELKPETVHVWDNYVEAVNTRNQKHLVPGSSFLSIDEIPDLAARVHAGEIVVSASGPHVPINVPSGLIHDWVGAAFIPNVTILDVLRVVRDYKRYKDVYHPNVLDSVPISMSDWEDRFSLLLINKSVIGRTVLDSDYQCSYTRLDDRRCYSITETERIREVADYGTASQHALPENEGTGLIWRLYSVARYEERDGGVYIELEAIALSRDIPFSLRWLIDPIVRRISRSSLVTSLQQTEDAVLSDTNRLSRSSARPDNVPVINALGASAIGSFH
jgi:hypothetical protein